jgi:hypothetical protein
MATLWRVTVQALDGDETTLRLESMSPDSGPILTDPAFALRVLYEPAVRFGPTLQYEATGPLGEAITSDQIHDETWMDAHAREFVRAAAVDDDRLAVAVTDPRWLEHLAPDDTWRSAAYA